MNRSPEDTTLETPRHLFQPPRYHTDRGTMHNNFQSAVENTDALAWDAASLLSMVSFGFVCGNRTLIEGVRRQPWMSSVDQTNQILLQEIPPHGRVWKAAGTTARVLKDRLLCEAEAACAGRDEIYLLLSGGLDSRIVAGVLALLWKSGRLKTLPLAVTWGQLQSRDVFFAREVAKRLGFPWKHLPLGPEHLRDNLHSAASDLGAMVSPVNLHRMDWFSTLENRPLVIAGSYGDSVGRSEFSEKTVLELSALSPRNRWGLLRDEVAAEAARSLKYDLETHRRRSGKQPEYVKCEHEHQGHYLRGLIGHTMSVINKQCTLYQMFTHPEVYSFMWSLHPSVRTDRVYTELLAQLGNGLVAIPWARTNRPLRGRGKKAPRTMSSTHHDYPRWCGETLYEEIRTLVDPDWFAATGIFCPDALRRFSALQRATKDRKCRTFDTWTWLASYRLLAEQIQTWTDRTVASAWHARRSKPPSLAPLPHGTDGLQLHQSPRISKAMDRWRRIVRRAVAVVKYPPQVASPGERPGLAAEEGQQLGREARQES